MFYCTITRTLRRLCSASMHRSSSTWNWTSWLAYARVRRKRVKPREFWRSEPPMVLLEEKAEFKAAELVYYFEPLKGFSSEPETYSCISSRCCFAWLL